MKTYQKYVLMFSVLIGFSISSIFIPDILAAIGVKKGDWGKYDVVIDIVGESSLSEELLEDFGEIAGVDWFRVEITSVTEDNIVVEMKIRYENGTEETETLEDALESGNVIPANLKEGDEVEAPIIGEPMKINGTITKEYAGVTRNINYLKSTVQESLFNITYESYWDQATGIMTEIYFSINGEFMGENLGASVSFKLIETNMFSTPPTGQWWFFPVIGIVVIAGMVVIVFFLRGRQGSI